MKKRELKQQIKQLIKESAKRSALHIDHLLSSGALDVEGEYPGNYGLAQTCACYLMQREAEHHKPMSREYKTILNNLNNF